MLYDYFKQCFAQVTNPPIDPIREELVMSLVSLIGPRPNLLEPEGAAGHKRLEVRTPILSNVDLERIRRIENHVDNAFRTYTLDITYPAAEGADGHGRGAGAPVRQGQRRWCARATTSSSSPTGRWAPIASPSRRCWPPPACTIT